MKSNSRTLVILLLAALFISVFGTMTAFNRINGIAGMTGAWGSGDTTRAAVNLTITSNLNINFTDDTANFGSGYIVTPNDACVFATDGTNDGRCTEFNNVTGFLLENQGNRYARINISNENYTNSLLGGTKSGYAWKWETPESPTDKMVTCNNATAAGLNATVNSAYGAYKNITQIFSIPTAFCDKLNYTDGNDIINMSFKMHLDITALARTVSDTWLVQAGDAGQ